MNRASACIAKDNVKMIRTLERLRDLGNTVIVVEHDEETIRAADWLVEIGPGPGVHGGEVVANGPPASGAGRRALADRGVSARRQTNRHSRDNAAPPGKGRLRIRGARQNNLQNLDVEIPLGVLVCVTGASGSGKSSLVHEIVYKKLASLRYDSRILAGSHDAFEGHEAVDDVIDIDQSPIGRSPRSNPATYVGIYDSIRELFAETDEAKARGFGPAQFSFNVKGGRCEECAGDGTIVTQLSFMPDVEVICPACKGRRYREETLEVTWRGRNIAEVLKLSIEESVAFFADQRAIVRKLETLHELGLGYLELGHAATILSGGEAQRVKLAAELGKMRRGRHNLYILDEPTTGLHLADIQRLLDCLQRLVDAGHSVLVIEHHLDVIKCADWILDLGPEGRPCRRPIDRGGHTGNGRRLPRIPHRACIEKAFRRSPAKSRRCQPRSAQVQDEGKGVLPDLYLSKRPPGCSIVSLSSDSAIRLKIASIYWPLPFPGFGTTNISNSPNAGWENRNVPWSISWSGLPRKRSEKHSPPAGAGKASALINSRSAAPPAPSKAESAFGRVWRICCNPKGDVQPRGGWGAPARSAAGRSCPPLSLKLRSGIFVAIA